MAITLNAVPTTEVISLEEYLEYTEAELDAEDDASVCSDASVRMFSRLLNHPTLVTDALNGELRRMPRTLGADYTATHLILAYNASFVVRANFWTPPDGDPEAFLFANYFNRYQQPHNHRFSFLTGGYSGSGYETTIYHYEAAEREALPGDKARLTFLEETSLPEGKIMFYEAVKDAHFQRVPREPSASINLLSIAKQGHTRPTISFDFERGVVTDTDVAGGSSRDVLFRLAEHVGDDRTADLIEAIAHTHAHPIMRAHSYRTLTRLRPTDRAAILRRAASDGHPYVAELARSAFGEEVAESWGAISK